MQVVNGALLPVTLFFVWRLARNEELMGEYRNSPVFDAVAGVTVLVTQRPVARPRRADADREGVASRR